MEGKFFSIHSGLDSTLVLDVEHGSTDPCSHVVIQHQSGSDSQRWYMDILAGTIRNKQTGFVLDYDFDKNIIVNNYQPNNRDQIWQLIDDGILFNEPNDRVMDIAGASTEPETFVVGWERNDGPSQQWEFQYSPPEYFFLKNKMNGNVLDVAEAKAEPGTPIVTWGQKKKDFENQLWFEDKQGILRSRLADLVIDGSDAKSIATAVYEPMCLAHVWVYREGKIVNGPANMDTVLEVKGRPIQKRMNGAKVGTDKSKKESEQIWEVIHAEI